MNILQQFLNAIQYRITDAWEHQWDSYEGAQALGCTNEFAAMTIVFSREDQTVIEITVSSEMEAEAQAAYRWMNPSYRDAIFAEADQRGIDRNEAFEGCQYIDLEVVDDVLEKGTAMLANAKYDPRVQIPLDMGDHQLLELFKAAHEKDVTLNQYMEDVLKRVISETKPKNAED